MNNHQHYLDLAVRAAQAGGQILMDYLGNLQNVRTKSATGDLVTEADEASELAILKILRAEVPEHGILAEESGLSSRDSDYLWAIDPLDGTLNYAHQVPFFCVSIGLLFQGQPVLGVVYAPRLQELFTGLPGHGAFLNQQPIHVSEVQTLKQAFLATGFPYRRAELEDNNYREFMAFANLTQDIRRPGSAALDLSYVACGRFDGFWERHLNSWDVAAGAALVLAAGGQVSAYNGQDLDPYSGEILVSNGHLQKKMQHVLAETRDV